ncbi:MAG: radical SAM protein [Bacilli bacterium]
MTVELRPLGTACNLACTYCYQEEVRTQYQNKGKAYDVELMLEKALATGQRFFLFGGEALLVPKKDLIRFFEKGYEIFKENGLQTNGSLIDDEHIEIFKKYNVHVGISIDGPNELNGLRKVRTRKQEDVEEKTLETTKTIMNNFVRLVEAGVSCSVIITLHRLNATKEHLPRLLNFIRWLGDIGVKGGNIHVLEVDKTMPDQEIHVLSQKENIYAMKELIKFFDENKDLCFNPFQDLKNAFENEDERVLCYMKNCDPHNTEAVYGIEGKGELSNCGRTNKDGIDWIKAYDFGYERYISLYNFPQELGGCKGCEYFLLCGGGCPGEAIDGDFRNKTIHCMTNKAIFKEYETRAIQNNFLPFSKRKDREVLEKIQLEGFLKREVRGVKASLKEVEHIYRKPIHVKVVREEE